MNNCIDDIDIAELKAADALERKRAWRSISGWDNDPQNERPDADEDAPGQYVEIIN